MKIEKLRALRDFYCYTDFFLNRGLAMFNSVYQVIKYTAFAGIIVEMLNKAFGINIPMDKVIYFTPILVILLIIAGIIDVKKLHVLQKNNEIGILYNPKLVSLIEGNRKKDAKD